MKKSFKKLLASLLVAIMVLSVSPVGALTEIDLSSLFSVEASALTSGSYTYTVSGTNATITKYDGTETSITIPSTLGGYTVTAIGDYAFRYLSQLESVSFPSTLKSIGRSAFYGCGIVNLTIPEGVTQIAVSAFATNNNLETLSLPSTLTTLSWESNSESGAFQNCPKLKTVKFTEGTKDLVIGGSAFYKCSALESVAIPSNCIKIDIHAFGYCTALKSVIWDEAKTSAVKQAIGEDAFIGCSALENLSLPKTLGSIGNTAFYLCGIVNLTIPEGVTYISEGAFSRCTKLKTVSLPSTLTTLGWNSTYDLGVFQDCENLETVIFEEGCNDLTIGTETFYKCRSLTTVHLPLNLVKICEDAFYLASKNVTICSKTEDSYGKKYATNNSLKFKLCDGTHSATPTTTYTVTYDANGGSVSPSTVSVKAGESVSLPIPSAKTFKITYNANGGSGAPSAQSFAVACKGWSTSSSATSASYSCGSKYTPTNNVTLYAVWNNATDVTVSTQIPMRSGYAFRGWSTVSNASTATVGVGSKWSITSDITLYAVWDKIPTPSYTEQNVSMNYKDSMYVSDAVTVETSDSGVASVSGDKITASGTGSADVTVTYADGSVCVYHIDVSYSWWQWIIVIVLFGWIWY